MIYLKKYLDRGDKMLKFMKYEIRGTYKFIMMLILGVLGASTGLQLSAYRGVKGNLDGFPVFLPILLVLVIFGAFVTAFFYIVSSFRKELYEDRGYLTFALPITGKQIVGTKLLIALMWSIAIGLSMVVFNLILGSALFGTRWVEGFKEIYRTIPANIELTMGLTSFISSTLSLLLIYFSITLSKVSIKNKKIGGLWFILFLVISALVNYATIKVGGLFPYYLDIDKFKIVKGVMFGDPLSVGYNISAMIFSIIAALATFFGTSYLIDKKVEI